VEVKYSHVALSTGVAVFATPKRSRLTHVLRLRISLIGVGLAGMALLASCGADPGSSATTLRPLTSTNYATTPPSVVTTVDPANTLPPAISYTIVGGDSVYAIASRFGVAPVELASYNNWPEGILHNLVVGQNILIPPSAMQTTTLPGLPIPTETTMPGPDPGQGKYTVVAGDSFSAIANQWGVTVSALMAANGWIDASVVILPGDEINIPAKTEP
jgi:LysM repeat protein